jgi:hypothetical protein
MTAGSPTGADLSRRGATAQEAAAPGTAGPRLTAAPDAPETAAAPSTGAPSAGATTRRTAERSAADEPGTALAATPTDAAGDGLSAAERRALARRLAELRRERQRLSEQLAAFDAAVPDQRPALLLAGDESVELVLDVGAARARQGGGGGVRPAGYRPDGRPRLY